MTLRQWVIDAFADAPFEGNPAAVVPLARWLDDALMQRIAAENNLSETAFFVATAPGRYGLRWFTPGAEVELCGHATLASAHVIFTHLKPALEGVTFDTLSGPLVVTRGADGLMEMDFPAAARTLLGDGREIGRRLAAATGCAEPDEIYATPDLMAAFPSAAHVRGFTPGGGLAGFLDAQGARGLIVTAPGEGGFDFVSRFFAPAIGVPEDPVTGSAHCRLAPYWSERLGKTRLIARQLSRRGGTVICELKNGRVALSGRCAPFLTGLIHLEAS